MTMTHIQHLATLRQEYNRLWQVWNLLITRNNKIYLEYFGHTEFTGKHAARRIRLELDRVERLMTYLYSRGEVIDMGK